MPQEATPDRGLAAVKRTRDSAKIVHIRANAQPDGGSGGTGGGGTAEPGQFFDPRKHKDNAESLLARKFRAGGYATLLLQNKDWVHWSADRGWRVIEKEAIQAEIGRFFEGLPTLDAKGNRQIFSVNNRFVSEIYTALERLLHTDDPLQAPSYQAPPDANAAAEQLAWGRANRLVLVANGCVNCMTGDLIDPTPALFCMGASPIKYDLEAKCPTWLNFLHQVFGDDAETKRTLQEYAGYCLTDMTDQEKCLWVIGPSGSGKSTILRVIGGIVGSLNVGASDFSTLGQQFGLMPFLGKKVGLVPEVRVSDKSDKKLALSRILSVVGRDPVCIDRKQGKFWNGRLGTRLLFASNQLPELLDDGAAMMRRTLLIQTKHSFTGMEDANLEEKIMAEGPGLLNWFLEGLASLLRRGKFIQPSASLRGLRQLQDLASPMTAFLRECTEMDPEDDVHTSKTDVDTEDLYHARLAWDRVQGNRKGLRQTDFGVQLRAVRPGVERKLRRRSGGKGGRRYVYPGLSLNAYGLSLLGSTGDRSEEPTLPGLDDVSRRTDGTTDPFEDRMP